MIKVYFESSAHADEVASFSNTETFRVCLPALEKLAEKARMKVTESVKEKPIIKHFAFGSDLVNEIQNYDQDNPEELSDNLGGNIITKEFSSEKEYKAYLEALQDLEGWNNYAIVEPEEVEKFNFLI